MQNLGAQIEHDYAVLDDIQKHLSMEDEDKNGGYLCTYPVFQGIYQMVLRMMRRNGQSVYLMLCTVTDYKGNPMKDGAKLEELSSVLGMQSVIPCGAVTRLTVMVRGSIWFFW